MDEQIKEECQHLKNIQYKTMLLNGKNAHLATASTSDTTNVDLFLANEMKLKKNLSWSRIDRSDKHRKLSAFAEVYGAENEFTPEEITALQVYLIASLDRNRLIKVKEVKYNKLTDTIESIPCLTYHKPSRKFTLKRLEKRDSTINSLGNKSNSIL